MPADNFFSRLINNALRKVLSVEENADRNLRNPVKFLIIRQHNQLGDLLASVSLFRAVKETYPGCHVTFIASPVNYHGLIKNRYIDRIFIFDKKRLFNPLYVNQLRNVLNGSYDIVIVPVVVSISFTSNLLARLCDAKIRIGPASLNGTENKSAYFFDRRIEIDFESEPDSNVADRILQIVKPFGISTSELKSEINFDEKDRQKAAGFIKSLGLKPEEYLIGLHAGAGKSPNRWSLYKYLELIEELASNTPVNFYLTGSLKDREENEFLKKHSKFISGEFISEPITQVAALISMSDLFICNDTGIMHVAGATGTPQISLFGPTNPFNWAPIGENKIFIRRSEFIDDITVYDVLQECRRFIKPEGKNV